MGLHKAIETYNIFVLPVLLFIAQLEVPPDSVIQMEKAAVRKVAPGPGEWCSVADMHHARELGQGVQLRPLQVTCCAVRLRTHAWEGGEGAGVPWGRLARDVRKAREDTAQQP